MFRVIFENIKNTIEIKQSEKKLFRILFLHSFLIGLASSFFFVEASRNFILKVSISEIPVAYIFSGLTGYLLIRVFKNWQRKFGKKRSYELIVLLFAITMLLLFAGQVLLDKNLFFVKLFAYLGFVLIFAFATLFGVGFAGFCFSIFNLSQSKRLLALLGTGEIVASILGFLIISLLLKGLVSSNYLLILALFFALLSIWPIRKVDKEMGHVITNVDIVIKPINVFNLAFILKNPFILYLTLTTLFSIVTVYFIDYSYLISVRYFSTLTGVEVATVVALLFSIIKTGELFFSFFSANIISAAGMKRSVLLLPYLLIIGSVMGVLSILFFGANPIFIVCFLFINKWTDRVIRKSVTIPVTKIMFQINSPEERVQLQNNIDGVISQLSTIICGVLLVVVCYFSNTNNYNKFLSIITLVCLIVFLILLFFSKRLYMMYKNQIQHYLQSNHQDPILNTTLLTKDKELADFKSGVNIEEVFSDRFKILLNETDLFNKEKIRSLICYYNPTAVAYLHFSENDNLQLEAESIRKISKLYFENQNQFSRLSIISYFLFFDHDKRLTFFKDIEKVTPLRLRAYFLQHLCNIDQIIDESQEFYFFDLVSECVNEILWSEAAIEDLKELTDPKLVNQIVLHLSELKQVLLYLLQLLHDPKSIHLIREILNNVDRTEDDLLFIVELLENILRAELQKMVIPIFEPISPVTRRNKLQNTFFINQLAINDRLLDILMHDFNLIDSFSKQLALEALMERNQDSEVIKAFKYSKISNLKLVAASLERKDEFYNLYLQKNKIATQFCDFFSLNDQDKSNIVRWCFNDNSNAFSSDLAVANRLGFSNNVLRIPTSFSPNSFLEIDLLAPVLLYKIKHK